MTTLYDEIRRAIGHPSGITPRLPGEPPSTWQARAVLERLEALEAERTDGEEEGGMLDRIAQVIGLYPEMVEDEHVRPLADMIHAITVRPAIRRLTRERDHLRESTNTAEAERGQLRCDLTTVEGQRADYRATLKRVTAEHLAASARVRALAQAAERTGCGAGWDLDPAAVLAALDQADLPVKELRPNTGDGQSLPCVSCPVVTPDASFCCGMPYCDNCLPRHQCDTDKAAIARVRLVHHLTEWVSLSDVCHKHHAFRQVGPTPEAIAIADVCGDCRPRRYMNCVCGDDACPVLAALDQHEEGTQ